MVFFLKFYRYGAVYLCGHLHALLNSKGTQHLYGYHHLRDSSLLELELGDFQTNRRFRVMAVDHDMISFTDVSFNRWPVVVITCPKHAEYTIRDKEPLGRMNHATHIRQAIRYLKNCIMRPNCALDRRSILCLYVPGFQRQVFKHIKILSERSKENKEQKKNKRSNYKRGNCAKKTGTDSSFKSGI